LLIAFLMMIAINMQCVRLLFQTKNSQFHKVVTFFKYVLLFNILQLVVRGALFISGKFNLTAAEPNPFVYQLGWFSLTLFAACILTGGLMLISQHRILELEARAERDPLTGLLNRFSMQQRLSAELNRCQRDQQPLTLLIFDIDHFKQVNDTLGHQMGDLVIQQVASVSLAAFRNYDLVFRIGGEEFLVCLPGIAQQQAAEKAELLRQQVQSLKILADSAVTISIGFVVAKPGQDLTSLIKQADDALYHAKGNGRNRAACWCGGEFVCPV
ncbi:MAG: GGDEF domain-containing protein, partial [Rheinheimera sp.]